MNIAQKIFLKIFLLSFISFSASAQLSEGFESGLPTSAPSTETSVTLSSGTWLIFKGAQTSTKHSGTYALALSSGSTTPTYATTPSLNTAGTLTYWARGGGSGTLTIQKSVNGGAFTTFTTQAFTSTYAQYSIDINDYSSDVRIRFQNTQGTTFYLDDVNITALASAVLSVSSSSLSSFGNVVIGISSPSLSYTISGSKLTSDVKVKATAGFQVSGDNSFFSDSILIAPTDGNVIAVPIYVRFTPITPIGNMSGQIFNSADSALTQCVNVSGVALATEPTIPGSLSIGTITGNSIELNISPGNGNKRILLARADAPVTYLPNDGIISTGVNSDFSLAVDKGNGNKILFDSTLTSIIISGLTSGQTYYFAMYEYNVGTGNSHNYLTTAIATASATTNTVPQIQTSVSSLPFGNVLIDSISSIKAYTITGNFLSPEIGNITLSASFPFEISTTSGAGFSSSLTLPYSGSKLDATAVYVRFKPLASMSYNGIISHTGGNADTAFIKLAGTGVSQLIPTYPTYIVAKDGSGDFTTIQAAVDAVPANNSNWFVILIKNGTYNEHVFIANSYIALVGENRDSTIISLDLDRAVWNSYTGVTNTGSGVVNIGCTAPDPTTKVMTKVNITEIFIGNMTIKNTATVGSSTVYTHAIRGESTATHIAVVHCNVLADGSDTVALWNTTTGMYYHAFCYFKGKIDAICPRGWCYDIGSTYVEVGNSAPIWHEGAAGSGQIFVIRNAYVMPDAPKNFSLLNYQKEGTFYLLDSYFYNSGGKTISQGSAYKSYYYNCHMEGGDASWHANNLSTAPGSPTQSQITPAWTFNNEWDPENTMPAVLPHASLPQPSYKAYDVPKTLSELKWVGARNANSYNIYFGKTNNPPLVANQINTSYSLSSLNGGTTYYWRVEAVTDTGIVAGSIWQFTTSGTSSVESEINLRPKETILYQNYPNPFNPETVISFQLSEVGFVTLRVFDVLGREVTTLVNEVKSAGKYSINWNASKLPSGIYFCQLTTNGKTQSRKIILSK